jgi:hypothetical protein
MPLLGASSVGAVATALPPSVWPCGTADCGTALRTFGFRDGAGWAAAAPAHIPSTSAEAIDDSAKTFRSDLMSLLQSTRRSVYQDSLRNQLR